MNKTLQAAIVSALLMTGQGLALPETAMAQETATQAYRIPAGDLDGALRQYAAQNKLQLVYPAELVEGKRSPGLSGSYTQSEALERLLVGSGLQAQPINARTIGLKQVQAPVPAPAERPGSTARDGAGAEREPVTIETMTVTGTRIRGGVTASPAIAISAAQIQEEGFTDLGQVIRSVPQNFSGGQNPGVAVGATLGAGGLANQNITGGSGLNLRGLGPDATLTLINGRRLSYGGFVQAVDISAIPVEAVEQIEIVPDGASAIYGSDAVGGVGNVILKRDFEGVMVGARYGGATGGGLTTREYSATTGATWSSGGLIATYKNVSTDPIYARQRDYTRRMSEPTTLYPDSDLRSGLLSAHQSFGDTVELRLDALRTEREQLFYPWNTSVLSYYNRMTPETTTSLLSPSVDVSLPNDWMLRLGGSWGKDRHITRQTRVGIETGVLTPTSYQCYCNEIVAYEAGAEGPLFTLPGGDARLAVGAGYRRNEFALNNHLTDTVVTQGSESGRFAYAEVNLPLVGPGSSIAGVRRLALTAAVRREDYDSFGSVSTPKLGLIYGPSADFTLKASWGKSYKAPTLFQRYWTQQAILYPAATLGGTGDLSGGTVLAFGGGNPGLDAEHARTSTASLAFHPEALPGLETELTYFDIDYTDRVVEPITDWAQALVNPNYAQFIDYSAAAQTQEALLAAADVFYNYSGEAYDPGNVVAILYAQRINVARQRIRGLDLSGSYRFDLGPGRLTIRGSTSWLDSSQQATPSQDAYDLAGMLFNPAKINSRIGSVWTQAGFSASGFVNYVSGVTNLLATGPAEKTSSFTTIDATLRYETGEHHGALSGLEFALSAQNLLNRDPPFYTTTALDRPPYDSTNYSAIGRFLSLSVSKRW